MSTLAVTYDDRPKVRAYCERFARRFEILNDIPAVVIPKDEWPKRAPLPHCGKLWVWDMVPRNVDRVIWFDSDVIPCRPIGPLPDAPAGMVVDSKSWVRSELWALFPRMKGLWPYYNSGVIYMRRDFEPVMVKAREVIQEHTNHLGQSEFGVFRDQHALNIALHEMGSSKYATMLPSIFNWHWVARHGISAPKMLHLNCSHFTPDKWHVADMILSVTPDEVLNVLKERPVDGRFVRIFE